MCLFMTALFKSFLCKALWSNIAYEMRYVNKLALNMILVYYNICVEMNIN